MARVGRPPLWLFRVSYTLYPAIGLVVSLSATMLVSLLFRRSNPPLHDIDPLLFSPVVRRYLWPAAPPKDQSAVRLS